jgi:hypothetical protein
VIDKEALPDPGAGMDFDAGGKTDQVGDPPRQQLPTVIPKPVVQTVPRQGVNPRVAKDDFPAGPGGRVAFAGDLDIFFQPRKRKYLKKCKFFRGLGANIASGRCQS